MNYKYFRVDIDRLGDTYCPIHRVSYDNILSYWHIDSGHWDRYMDIRTLGDLRTYMFKRYPSSSYSVGQITEEEAHSEIAKMKVARELVK